MKTLSVGSCVSNYVIIPLTVDQLWISSIINCYNNLISESIKPLINYYLPQTDSNKCVSLSVVIRSLCTRSRKRF